MILIDSNVTIAQMAAADLGGVIIYRSYRNISGVSYFTDG